MRWPHRHRGPQPTPNLDERFSLHPQEGEDVLRSVLSADDKESEHQEDEDS